MKLLQFHYICYCLPATKFTVLMPLALDRKNWNVVYVLYFSISMSLRINHLCFKKKKKRLIPHLLLVFTCMFWDFNFLPRKGGRIKQELLHKNFRRKRRSNFCDYLAGKKGILERKKKCNILKERVRKNAL